jgi:hypothetical protein
VSTRRPWRRCKVCPGTCAWVDPAWVCRKCGREYRVDDGDQFAPPGAVALELATCSYVEWREDMGVGVRISQGTPRWIRREEPWPYVPELAPSRSYLNVPDESVFIDRYLSQLNAVGAGRIRQALDAIAAKHQGRRLVLLCFEKLTKGEPCHRRYFAAWWQTTTGQAIPELGAVPTHEQLSLDVGGEP